jgi:hypothetical protein
MSEPVNFNGKNTIIEHKPGDGVLQVDSDFTYREYTYSRLFKDDFNNYI